MRNEDIEKARNGDRDAFNGLLESYKGLAYSIALKYVRQEADAEDIVQEAFIKVFLHIRKFRNESAFSTWLFKIVYYESLRHLGKRKPAGEIREDNHSYEMPEGEGLAEKEKSTLIREAMRSLSENEYLVIHLFYLAEKTIREIEQITDQSKANIKVLLHRARKKMADYFDKHRISKDLI